MRTPLALAVILVIAATFALVSVHNGIIKGCKQDNRIVAQGIFPHCK